jgi:thiol-disulfide isomerase/thioredoxin
MTRRREVLLTAGAAAVAGLAGCLDEGGAATSTASDVIRLSSLDVGPSPGGTVPVREPGTVSLVDFFATWCAPCEPQMENLDAVRSRYGDRELYVTSVTSESDEGAIRQFWKEYDGNWAVLLDPELVATQGYQVKGIPTLVLLDGDGDVVWRHRGLAGKDTLLSKVGEAIDG